MALRLKDPELYSNLKILSIYPALKVTTFYVHNTWSMWVYKLQQKPIAGPCKVKLFVVLFSILVGCRALSIINIRLGVKHTAKVAVPTQVENFSRLRAWYLFNIYASKGYGMNRSAIKVKWSWKSKLLSGRQLELVNITYRVTGKSTSEFRHLAQIKMIIKPNPPQYKHIFSNTIYKKLSR